MRGNARASRPLNIPEKTLDCDMSQVYYLHMVEMSLTGRAKMEIENKTIQVDISGAGQGWRVADEDLCPANVQQEIAAEIIDGKVSETRDYVASNGVHYRWS